MKRFFLFAMLLFSVTLFAQQNCGTVTDYEGHTYGTVKIGQQCWMTENLRTVYYADGVSIPMAMIYNGVNANTDTVFNLATYGRLYDRNSVMRGATSEACQGVCPDGWHIPTVQEYQVLISAYNAFSLRSTNYWLKSSGSNVSGFDMRPGGLFKGSNNRCENLGGEAYFYTSTMHGGEPVHLKASCDCWELMFVQSIPDNAFSVRCVKIEESETPTEPVDGQPCPGTLTVTDIDGNTYNTVQIGDQCWMKENLRTTKYSDGTTIALGSSTSTSTAYLYYPNGNASKVATYGYLYNWKAVMRSSSSSTSNPSGVKGICPTGWHVPSDAEWTQLTNYVSSQDIYCCNNNSVKISKALAGTTGWCSSTTACAVGNTPANNNSTGFSAVPAGYYTSYGYYNFGSGAYFWSATQTNSDYAYNWNLNYDDANVGSGDVNKYVGYSVRCLKDEENTTPTEPTTPVDAQPCPGAATVTDIDGNTYNTVQIGDQCWMKENLRTTKYSDGTTIALVGSTTSETTAYRYNPDNNASNVATYGYLYNWKAVMHNSSSSSTNPSGVQGICPTGWHVPSDAEWTQLTDYVSSQSEYVCDNASSSIAKALAPTSGWRSSTTTCAVGNTPANNNATNFSAVPAGYFYSNGCYGFGGDALFWSATQYDSSDAYYRYLACGRANVYSDYSYKNYGYSVRCLRD